MTDLDGEGRYECSPAIRCAFFAPLLFALLTDYARHVPEAEATHTLAGIN
ncbi:hypothetical protein [Burkholderia glumae]|nr:hypothetical protein [Burkholderia glumae]